MKIADATGKLIENLFDKAFSAPVLLDLSDLTIAAKPKKEVDLTTFKNGAVFAHIPIEHSRETHISLIFKGGSAAESLPDLAHFADHFLI